MDAETSIEFTRFQSALAVGVFKDAPKDSNDPLIKAFQSALAVGVFKDTAGSGGFCHLLVSVRVSGWRL